MLNRFAGKKVLITGHTGFKGSWLATWLIALKAKVVGLSLDPHTEPSIYKCNNLSRYIDDYRGNILDFAFVSEIFERNQFDFIFHLAAQALVHKSYKNPLETFNTNVMGTINILECMRTIKHPCVAVLITSDKCYSNKEWIWGYRETDELGGSDPYSASKAAADIAISSYVKSYFPVCSTRTRIAVARAGNVVGGGDWSDDRIIPDCIRAWVKNDIVTLRQPNATRPWQHVLDPLSGYLNLASELTNNLKLHGEAFNFGPSSVQNKSVQELVECMEKIWDQVRWRHIPDSLNTVHEAGLLKLNCDKSLHFLNWKAIFDFEQTVRFTAKWYKQYYNNPECSMQDFTREQICAYTHIAKSKGAAWAQ